MKKQKILLTWILAVVLVVATLALVACDDKPQTERLDVTVQLEYNQMAVVVRCGDQFDVIPVTLGEGYADVTTAEGVLNYLQQSGALEIVWIDSDFGKYINSIGGAVPQAMNEYVEVFTSVRTEMGTWAGVTTYLIGDVTICSAAVGVSELTVAPGVILYFQVSTY